jgi:exodeoxyribonuclease V gamma subunit
VFAIHIVHDDPMMSLNSDFRLYHSNALTVLAALLAKTLREDHQADALLVPETILIPHPSMKRWLHIYLAETFGIAANFRCITPGEFVAECLQTNVTEHATSMLNTESMCWRLFSILSDPIQRAHPALKAISDYLQGSRSALKAWALASECAAAFEKYQAWRRDWCLQWDKGQDPQDWQAHLWREAVRGQSHRAVAIDHYLQQFETGDRIPHGLPRRLFVFACSNVSPDVLRIIATAAKAGTLHFFLPSPCRKYWGDLQSVRPPSLHYDPSLFAAEENPLLQQWAYSGRDFVAALFSNQHIQLRADIEAYEELPDTHLLNKIRMDVLQRRAPSVQHNAVDINDSSLQVHSCHTPLREVQVLHDQLHRLLLQRPDLQPRDIAIMAPDIQIYAPYIDTVFGMARNTNRFIPYSISDQATAAATSVAALFLRFFELPQLAFTSSEVLALLSHPDMLQALNADAACLQWWPSWIEQSGVRWGLHAQHRQQQGAPAEHLSTWAFALDRLLLGYASGDTAPIEQVEPVIHVEGQQALQALDALIRGLRLLAFYQAQFRRAHTPEQWAALCTRWLNTIYSDGADRVDNAHVQVIESIQQWSNDLHLHCKHAGLENSIAAEVVHAYFKEKFAAAEGANRILTGGVNVCRMVPMRQIPFQVICLLGLNEGQMPRTEPSGMIQRLHQEIKSTSTRRYGDRSLREDDRYLFLQLMMAADQVFYLSYVGQDAKDNTALPPSPLISELLDTIKEMYPHEAALETRFVLQHSLHPFSPPPRHDHQHTDDARHMRFDSAWQAQHSPLSMISSNAAPSAEKSLIVDVQDFLRFFQHPARYFLRQRCNVQLNSRFDPLAEFEPFEADRGLAGYQLKRAMLEACLESDSIDKAYWLQRFRQQVRLAPGISGEQSFNKILASIHPIAKRVRAWRSGSVGNIDIDIPLSDSVLQGQLDAVYPAGIERIVLGELKGKHHCLHGIEMLLLSAMSLDVPMHEFYFRNNAIETLRPALKKQTAIDALHKLIAIYRAGQHAPLAFLPDAGYVYFKQYQKQTLADAAFSESAWTYAYDVWPNTPGEYKHHDIWCATALRGHDPFLNANGSPETSLASLEFHRLSLQIFSTIASPDSEGDHNDE